MIFSTSMAECGAASALLTNGNMNGKPILTSTGNDGEGDSISFTQAATRKDGDNDYLETDDLPISSAALLRVVQGVAVATKSPARDVVPVSKCISSARIAPDSESLTRLVPIDADDETRVGPSQHDHKFSLRQWQTYFSSYIKDERSQQIATLTLAVTYLREHSRATQCAPISPPRMNLVWNTIRAVLVNESAALPLCTPSRSAQGFLSVALCSLIEDGNIAELFRLHVWLPDGNRGPSENAIHSHQPFAQSWILAGQGRDLRYDVEPAPNLESATHAAYKLAWNDNNGKDLSSTYKTHQASSVVTNTGSLYRATLIGEEIHARDTTYFVPSAEYHYSDVDRHTFHATLFFFDSQRGFDKEAGVLGPMEGTSFEQRRDPAGVTASRLADMVQAMRGYEIHLQAGRDFVERGDLRCAEDNFNAALQYVRSKHFPLQKPGYLKDITAELLKA